MTCTRAQVLIESASFMDWPAAEREAAQRHAQGCEACRPFLASETDLAANLQALSAAVETPNLTAGVLTRIASSANRSVEVTARSDRGALWWWLPAAAVVAIALALGVLSPRALERMPGFFQMRMSSRGVLQPAFTLVSIALYLAVLLLPMRTHHREGRV
jgi:hypothetical protein